jgi:hypothetical protein
MLISRSSATSRVDGDEVSRHHQSISNYEACHQRIWNNSRHRPCSSLVPMSSTKSNVGQTQSRHIDHDKVQATIDNFISTVQASLQDESFVSFTLKGPTAPRQKKQKGKSNATCEDDARLIAEQKEKLRGKYKLITGRLIRLQNKKRKKSASNDDTTGVVCLQATIKYHLATDVAHNWKVEGITGDGSEVERGLKRLFLTAMGVHDNDDQMLLSEWGRPRQDGSNGEMGIISGELFTTSGVHKLQLSPSSKAKFTLSKQKVAQENEVGSQPIISSHDKAKNVPLSPSSLFFQKLGVSNSEGKPTVGMASKLRQCQKYVEIVGNLIDNSSSSTFGDASSSIDSSTSIRVIDMGCGRGYLTFSLHSYLCNKFLPLKHSVHTQGIDIRPKLIQEINGIAQELGGDFNSLNFIEGAIGRTDGNLFESIRDSNGGSSLDILIALHACDTATDDAVWFGITHGVDIIVTAPCCQHELRPQIDNVATSSRNHPLNEILRHAIYRERSTEIVTDAMRGILLEIAGYDVQVFEFIGGEHTAKNVMITATKSKRTLDESRKEKWLQDRREKLAELAKLYGITRQRLATLMGEIIAEKQVAGGTAVKMSIGMPPL